MVGTHFLLALVVLAGAVALAVEAGATRAGASTRRLRRGCALTALVLVVACGILVVTGTLSTAAGPHPGDSAEIDRFWNLLDAVWWHVRATAAFGISFLLLVVLGRARTSRACRGSSRRRRCCSALLAAADGRRRDPVPESASLVARARPRRARGGRVGLDGRARDRSLADARSARAALDFRDGERGATDLRRVRN